MARREKTGKNNGVSDLSPPIHEKIKYLSAALDSTN
jgi:hypothetical protein